MFEKLCEVYDLYYRRWGSLSDQIKLEIRIQLSDISDDDYSYYTSEYYKTHYPLNHVKILNDHANAKETVQNAFASFLNSNQRFEIQDRDNQIVELSKSEELALPIVASIFEEELTKVDFVQKDRSFIRHLLVQDIYKEFESNLISYEMIKGSEVKFYLDKTANFQDYSSLLSKIKLRLNELNFRESESNASPLQVVDFLSLTWKRRTSESEFKNTVNHLFSIGQPITSSDIISKIKATSYDRNLAESFFRSALLRNDYVNSLKNNASDVDDFWNHNWDVNKIEKAKQIIPDKITEVIPKAKNEKREDLPLNKSKALVPILFLLGLGLAIFYFSWFKTYLAEKDLPHFYSLATDVVIRSSPENYNNNNIISEMLPFGAEVRVFPETSGDFTKVRLENPAIRGYMATKYLISKEDFDIVKKLFPNPDALSAVDKFIYRKALLDFLKNTNSAAMNWTLRNPVAQSNKKMVYPNAVEYRDAKGKLIYEKVDEAKYFSVYISSTSSSTTKRVNFTVENKKEVYFVSESYGETE